MDYTERFKSTDILIPHMDGFIPTVKNPLIRAKYIGLLAIAGVTTYELAIKDIFYHFSDKKHIVLGNVARNRFEKINGRIKLKDLQDNQIFFFGDKYKTRFKKKLKLHRDSYLTLNKKDIISSYNNLIIWRHDFVHENNILATYEDVKNSYNHGKEVIHCLSKTMVR